jgi:hypothetical protein
MQHLSRSELTELVQAITEMHGNRLNRCEFVECCLQAFEDISGMEGIEPRCAVDIINLLWDIYRDQTST